MEVGCELGVNPLPGLAVDAVKGGAQGGVTRDQLLQTSFQGLGVEGAVDP